jgi:hypothetical protein
MQYSFSKFFSMKVYFGLCLIKGREKEKQKSLETVLWMPICGCGLPAHLCQPAVAGGIIYAHLGSEVNTHLAPQTLFTQSSPGRNHHCYKLSPFQAHWGRWHCTRFHRLVCLLQLTWEVGLPSFPVEFSSLHHFYKLSCFWLLGMCHHSCLFQPGLFIYSSMRDSPPHLFAAQGAPPSLLHVFFLLLLIIQFFFFPWVEVDLSRRLCWSGPGLSVGVPCTT